MNRKNRYLAVIITLLTVISAGCGEKLKVEEDLGRERYSLLNEDSTKVIFPDYIKSKATVLSFLFTHCPDICPLTTNNMQHIQERLKKENVDGVEFVSISFDPDRDSPSVLKQYSGLREIDNTNWHFLTGKQQVIDSLRRKLHYMAIAGDTTKTTESKPYYFYIHTDRIYLLDDKAQVRKNYRGSTVDINEVIKDIKTLL